MLTEAMLARPPTSLFPSSTSDLAVELREYFIPDFSNWKDHDAFEVSFARLLEDLRAEEPAKLKGT